MYLEIRMCGIPYHYRNFVVMATEVELYTPIFTESQTGA